MRRVTVVAPARALDREVAGRVLDLAAEHAPELKITFSAQCFDAHGHFAGSDDVRRSAFLKAANDPDVDAVWFARGGYGSVRLLDGMVDELGDAARAKTYAGYSDTGALLGCLYGAGIGRCLHAPMPSDVSRTGGDKAILRGFAALESPPSASASSGSPQAAFNLTVLAALNGTRHMPDLAGHILHLEDIGEYHYRLDRSFAQLATSDWFPRLAGVRIGRFSDITENDIDFSMTAEEIARHWCSAAGVPVIGSSPIGHDADNEVVAFG